MSDEQKRLHRYVALNQCSRHELIEACLVGQDEVSRLRSLRESLDSALYDHLNRNLSAQDAINRVRKALYPGWDGK